MLRWQDLANIPPALRFEHIAHSPVEDAALANMPDDAKGHPDPAIVRAARLSVREWAAKLDDGEVARAYLAWLDLWDEKDRALREKQERQGTVQASEIEATVALPSIPAPPSR